MKWFPDQADRDGWVHRLANLVLLSRKKNSEAQNFDFETKKEKYFKSDKGVSPFVLTTQVLGQTEWTSELLKHRQAALLEKLRDLWSLLEWDAEIAQDGEDAASALTEPEIPSKLPERYDIRKKFWTGLLLVAKGKSQLHANRSPVQHGWLGAGAGKAGLGFNYGVREHDTQVELFIHRGPGAQAENKAIFDQLFEQKASIEKAFGDDLKWERLDDNLACAIRKVIDRGGWRDAENWPLIHEATAEAMVRLEAALKPAIAKLNL